MTDGADMGSCIPDDAEALESDVPDSSSVPSGSVLASTPPIEPLSDNAVATEPGTEDDSGVGQMPTNAMFREMVLTVFSSGQALTGKDVITRISDSGLLDDLGTHQMADGKPAYESKVKLAIWRLWKTYDYLDRLEDGRMRINDAGRQECLRLGIVKDLYGKKEFLRDVYMGEDDYRRLRGVLLSKKNLILQGPPGVGKTFCARRLAWSIMGERDNSRIEMVQFHQSYGYEDFILGYKPEKEGFVLKEGVFLRFCRKASADPKRPYFFIIDEINRGNLSKIFGEVMMLIESDYRGQELRLAYHDEPFMIPENLYLVGMMNTADRSLALIDYALRRRFAFFGMRPGFDSARFNEYRDSLANESLNRLIDQLRLLNTEIREDPSLGRGFEIGHSRLCGQKHVDDEWLRGVVEYDIIPTLEEYWFDDEDKVDGWRDALMGALA